MSEGFARVEVTRNGLIESVHRAAACVADARGGVFLACGEIDEPIFLRSAAKPFIAATVLAAGVGERYDLTQREVAVMAGSHAGEPFHVEAVRSILQKIGMDESALQCGAQMPYNAAASAALMRSGKEPTALHNNCSGKHAGILALCKAIGADPTTYLEVDNPAERHILRWCARLSDDDPAAWPLGIDGCGIPVYATPLRRAALAFARFATLERVDARDATALRSVRDAMVAFPEYVSGSRTFDTELIRAGAGNLAAKAGAEGVHCVACIGPGLGYASKIVDGAGRARPPLTMAALEAVGVLDGAKMELLTGFSRPVVYNRAGRAVGEIRARIVAVEKAR